MIANDAAARRDARKIVAEFQEGALPPMNTPAYGLTDDEFDRIGRAYEEDLKAAQAALARGNIEFVEGEVEELLYIFRIRLDPTTASYRQLGTLVLQEHVKALQALQRRQLERTGAPSLAETTTGTDLPLLRSHWITAAKSKPTREPFLAGPPEVWCGSGGRQRTLTPF